MEGTVPNPVREMLLGLTSENPTTKFKVLYIIQELKEGWHWFVIVILSFLWITAFGAFWLA